MPILYALVADGRKVLAEYTDSDGNFKQIARQILVEVPRNKHRRAYEADNVVFNYAAEDSGLIVLCMTTAGSEARLPWAYITDVTDRFITQYGDTFHRYGDLALNDIFGRVLREQMEWFNDNPSDERVRRIRGEIDAVKDVMVQNIDKVLERGEKIEILVQQTNRLQTQSVGFVKRSKDLKCSLWCKNVKLMICIGVLCIVLIVIIIVIIIVALKLLGVF